MPNFSKEPLWDFETYGKLDLKHIAMKPVSPRHSHFQNTHAQAFAGGRSSAYGPIGASGNKAGVGVGASPFTMKSYAGAGATAIGPYSRAVEVGAAAAKNIKPFAFDTQSPTTALQL